MKKVVKAFGKPTILSTEKAPALLCSFNKLKEQGYYKCTIHCTIKLLNNLIKQGHIHINRYLVKFTEFQNFRDVSLRIKEIETIYALYKRKRSLKQNLKHNISLLQILTLF